MMKKVSQKYMVHKNPEVDLARTDEENSYNLKVVKLPLSRLIPITMEKYR